MQLLDEAVSEARSVVQRSPAWDYLRERGVTPCTALVYGLGYGIPAPRFHREIIDAARQSMMVRRDGIWLWMGGVVYTDPPTHLAVMNVRYIPEKQLPEGTRNFIPLKNHKTWGNRVQPLGGWRITPATRTLIVLEGVFDMLITAQKIHQLGCKANTVVVYTNGASPSAKMSLSPRLARSLRYPNRSWARKSSCLLCPVRQWQSLRRSLAPLWRAKSS